MSSVVAGQKFGNWTVIDPCAEKVVTKTGSYEKALCKCSCGNVRKVCIKNLIQGFSKSCGCGAKKKTIERNTTHAMSNTRLYMTWENMRKRCRNKEGKRYERYGGRGITVCDEWNNDFSAFCDWALSNGYSDNLTIDRIDNNKGYCPENCRWVDIKTQCRNRSSNVLITINGQTKTMIEWCEYYGTDVDRASARRKSGWNDFDAVSKPPMKSRAVIRVDSDGNETFYASVREASNKNGVDASAICMVCRGIHKTSAGYFWKYASA